MLLGLTLFTDKASLLLRSGVFVRHLSILASANNISPVYRGGQDGSQIRGR